MTTTVTKPGLYEMPEADYFADPALSSSGMRRLLPPSCPAIFHHEQVNGRPEKRTFDFGHGAHKYVLGVGADVEVIQRTEKDGSSSDAEDLRTTSAREHRDAIHAAGRVPLLRSEDDRARAMARALHTHPAAALLMEPGSGLPERSLFAQDPRLGVWLRGRLDWLRLFSGDGDADVVDYKTVASANPTAVQKSIATYGYHMQGAFYSDLVLALGLAERVRFLLIAQEKQPPYLTTVVEPDEYALGAGRAANQRAIELYAECTAFDHWPSWSDGVIPMGLPTWAPVDFPEDVTA